MEFADIKPGMRAVVTGTNKGRPGGELGMFNGKQFTVGTFLPSGKYEPKDWNPDFNGEEVWGAFRMLDIEGENENQNNRWVLHPSQFKIVADEKGNPVVDDVVKKKPLRGPDGRFLPKNAKPIKAVKAVKVKTGADEIEERLRASVKVKDNGLGVSTNGIRYANGDFRLNPSDICAARFYPERADATDAIVIIDEYYKLFEEETKKHYREFLNYLFNDSPWKQCFLTKIVAFAVEHYVAFDVNQPATHVNSAQQVMRQFSEFQHVRDDYAAFRKHFSVAHSVFLVCYFQRRGGEQYIIRPDSGHTCVYAYGITDQIKRTFKQGELVACDTEFKKKRHNLYGICCAVAKTAEYKDMRKAGNFTFDAMTLTGKKFDEAGWAAGGTPKYSINELAMIIGMIFG